MRSSTKGGNLHRNERGRLGFGQQELRRRTLETAALGPLCLHDPPQLTRHAVGCLPQKELIEAPLTRSRSPCQSPAMPNGRCRMHGGKSPGAPKGNKNAFKHGRYTAEAAARRRDIASLLRSTRRLAKDAE